MAQLDCEPLTGQFPWPPSNAMAMSAFRSSDADIRWDDPSELDTGPQVSGGPTTNAKATIVVNGNPTVLAAASGSFNVVSAPIAAGQYVEVGGLALTSVHGIPGADQFDGSSADPTVVAASIAAAINSGSVGGWGIASATSSVSTVTLTADTEGSEGNEITLSSGATNIVASGETFSGGSDRAYLTIGGRTLWAVDGPYTSGALDFDINDPGQSITDALNDSANGFTYISAQWTGTCIVITASVAGTAGNGISLSTNSDALVLAQSSTFGGSGTPCPPGQDNSRWNIVGVNIYRSDTGERGPYFRVNRVPVSTQFYRDRTDIVEVPAEVIPWNGGWVFKGDSPNNKGWRLRTRYRPMVKRSEDPITEITHNAVPADSPFDVEVYVDGVRAPVRQVFGPKGEVDLSTERVWDPSTETFVDPPIPTENSEVVIRYYYQRNPKLMNTLDRRYKVFYRLTTVAIDTTGTSPTGLVETPLDYSRPISPMNVEEFDYIWREAVKRNRWILEQGGERVKLFIKKANGIPCDCHWDPRLREYSKQPLNDCLRCFGTGWKGGYEGPYDIIIGPDDNERRVTQTPNGRRLEHAYEVWIGPSPMVSQRDFIVKQNGERYSIGPVRRTHIRGLVLQQAFQIGYLDVGEIRYQVPLHRLQLERLPWPETRYTDPTLAPCEDSPPYPIGCEPQATPMATEKASIPDGREQRGRTPVWQHIMYGGGGE